MKLAEGTCDNLIKISTKWDYVYDGGGVRTSTLTTPYDGNGNPLTASLTAYYFGGAYETRSDGSIFKYYREASLWDSFGGQSTRATIVVSSMNTNPLLALGLSLTC